MTYEKAGIVTYVIRCIKNRLHAVLLFPLASVSWTISSSPSGSMFPEAETKIRLSWFWMHWWLLFLISNIFSARTHTLLHYCLWCYQLFTMHAMYASWNLTRFVLWTCWACWGQIPCASTSEAWNWSTGLGFVFWGICATGALTPSQIKNY